MFFLEIKMNNLTTPMQRYHSARTIQDRRPALHNIAEGIDPDKLLILNLDYDFKMDLLPSKNRSIVKSAHSASILSKQNKPLTISKSNENDEYNGPYFDDAKPPRDKSIKPSSEKRLPLECDALSHLVRKLEHELDEISDIKFRPTNFNFNMCPPNRLAANFLKNRKKSSSTSTLSDRKVL